MKGTICESCVKMPWCITAHNMVDVADCDYYTPIRNQEAKADADKLTLSWVPPEIIEAVAKVRKYGNEKYGDPDNWRTVERERYHEAMLRHCLAAWNDSVAYSYQCGVSAGVEGGKIMRLIDADELFKAFERTAWYNNADRDEIAEEILLQMPTIEVELNLSDDEIEKAYRLRDLQYRCEDVKAHWENMHDSPFPYDDKTAEGIAERAYSILSKCDNYYESYWYCFEAAIKEFEEREQNEKI